MARFFASRRCNRWTQLRKVCAQLQQPPKRGRSIFARPDLVELTSLDPTIKLDIRYATTNDFLSSPMYLQARAFMQRPAAGGISASSSSSAGSGPATDC